VVLAAGTGEFTVSPPAVVLKDKTAGAERRVRLLAPPADRVSLVWEKVAGAAEREAALLARVDSVFQIGRGLILRDEQIVCRVQRGGIRSLRIEMPAGALVRSVVGADVLRWRVEEGGRAAEVTFARTVKDETRLAVRAEQSLAADQAALALSPVVVVGAGLQEGSLRLEPAKDLILNETAVVGAARSSEAAPAEARSLDYSYARLPASVTVEIVDREPKVAVATEALAVIEAGVLTLDDITDLARAQRVLAWGEMARRVAHEIKNPLTPIQLAIQELRSQYRGDDPAYRKMLDEATEIVTEEIVL
jgi:signal transduction histidine kinase